jgi:pyrimidine-nucleoside phosphorylase
MPDVNPVHLIAHKRDGQAVDADDIRALIDAYTDGDVPDYQMSAFLMAIYLNGLNDTEAAALTDAMLHSGRVLDLSDLPGTKVDKHSTGGVGDKVSLILAPIVAACGVPVPMISGRGLGHTGGTLDKLESIPGFRTDLSIEDYRRQLDDIGLVLIGQTAEMAPADRKLYALRDVTATVESIPLIAASIMSKKLAEGIDALVLDVKCGRGAFMKTEADARKLAETLTAIGEKNGTPTTALMTHMDIPLGRAVGNWPEVAESIACLRGEHADTELMEVVIGLAGEMLALGHAAETSEEGREMAQASIDDGSALDTFRTLVKTQNGDPAVVDHPDRRPGSDPVAEVVAPDTLEGTVTGIDALEIGFAAVDLGAGRRTKEDEVDPTAGLVFERTVGDTVEPGDVLARLYAQDESRIPAAQDAVAAAFTTEGDVPAPRSAIMDRYTRDGWLHGPDAADAV